LAFSHALQRPEARAGSTNPYGGIAVGHHIPPYGLL